jgi:outer membrane translocation and assembly module TamA
MLAAAATRFDDEAWGFDRLALDARGYLPLGSVQRVLAVRAYLSKDDAHDGARVPFFLQEPLSNSHTLRGYETFLDRGEKIVSLQAEYRWEAAPALELALFADAGRAFRADEDVDLDRLRTGWGGGLRLKTWNDTLFRFDVARGEGHTRIYARFGASF